MDFADKLKKLRISLGLSQEQFAKKVNVSNAAISYWETRKRKPKLKIVSQISNACNISINELIDDDTLQLNQCSSNNEDLNSLISIYKSLNNENRQTILSIASALSESSKNTK